LELAPWLEKCEGRCFEPIELALDVVHPWDAGRHVLPAEVERALQPLREALHRAEARSDVLEQLAADIARKDARRRARRAEEG